MTSEAWCQLGSLVVDGATADSNGIVYHMKTLAGWWEGSSQRTSRSELAGAGEVITVARENARPIVLGIDATSTEPTTVPLGMLCFDAMEAIKDAARALYVPKLLVVHDIEVLQALVRVDGTIKTSILGHLVAVESQVALVAPDPRRYSIIETDEDLSLIGTDTTQDFYVDVDGTVDTPFVWTVEGPANNPRLTSHALGADSAHRPHIEWPGVLVAGLHLVVDTGSGIATVAGDPAQLTPGSQMFNLVPGTNQLTSERSSGSATSVIGITYHAAKD